jgi:hypothetical protein
MSLLADSVLGDSVQLQNGDRITGTITEMTAHSLKIKTHYAGTISLTTSAIASLQTDQIRQWKINLQPTETVIHPHEHAGQIYANGHAYKLSELLLESNPGGWKKSGLLETSLNVDNDEAPKEKFHVNTELQLQSDHWRHDIKAEAKRDKEHNRVTEDTFESNYQLDYFMTPQWFARSASTYRQEGTNFESHYWYSGLGPGYRLWGESKNKLDAVLTYNRFWFALGPLDWTFDAYTLTLDYQQFWFDGRLETYTDIEIAYPDISVIDYIANTSSGLRYHFQHNIHISLKYDFNESKLYKGKSRDSSYVLGAGVSF